MHKQPDYREFYDMLGFFSVEEYDINARIEELKELIGRCDAKRRVSAGDAQAMHAATYDILTHVRRLARFEA